MAAAFPPSIWRFDMAFGSLASAGDSLPEKRFAQKSIIFLG